MGVDSLASLKASFANWYRQFQVEDDVDQRESRLAGVIKAAKSDNVELLDTLVRLAFGTKKTPSAAEVSKIRDIFVASDERFPRAGNDQELKFLAAATLVQKLETTPSVTALAIITASCNGARVTDLPMDLIVRANATLNARAEINRQRPGAAAFGELTSLNFKSIQQKIQDNQSWQAVIDAFGEVQLLVKNAFSERAKQEKKIIDDLQKHLNQKDEELDFLWWLTSRYCQRLSCSFDKIPANANSLVMAKELADLTNLLPGPASIEGILSRAGLLDQKKILMTTALNAVPLEWARNFVDEQDYSPVLTPLHFALHRRVENGEGDEWVANWSNVTGIKNEFATTPLKLALTFYRECLLIKWA